MNIRRYYYPGQIVFITQVVKDRKPVFEDLEMVDLLTQVIHNVNDLHPFSMLAYVFLPDHFHILIRPTGQSNFSKVLHSIKLNFTRAYKKQINCTESINFWQKRFWDHIIRDERDLENHIHYIHYNPIKHAYVKDMSSWGNSSFFAWQKRGLYDKTFEWNELGNSSFGE